MGRIVLVGRLALRDLRHRYTEAGLLLLALAAATTTLTLGLVLHDAASDPYQSTREATNGPDIVASVEAAAAVSGLEDLVGAPEVVDHSGPYPVTTAELETSARTSDVQVVGRDTTPASVDQPELIEGGWVSDGGVVVEAAFAQSLGITTGDAVTLNGESFDVVGVAVTAAMAPYPEATCLVPCFVGGTPDDLSDAELQELVRNPGLVWLTRTDVSTLDPGSAVHVMFLTLTDSAEAQAFVDSFGLPDRDTQRCCIPGTRFSRRPPRSPETSRSFSCSERRSSVCSPWPASR